MSKPTHRFTTLPTAIAGVVATGVFLLLGPAPSSRADQIPPGCAGNGSGGNIGVSNGATHHVGDAVNFIVGVNVPAGQCQATNITARLTFPDGTHLDYATNLTLLPGTGINEPIGRALRPRALRLRGPPAGSWETDLRNQPPERLLLLTLLRQLGVRCGDSLWNRQYWAGNSQLIVLRLP